MKTQLPLTLILSEKREEGELPALPCNTGEIVCASARPASRPAPAIGRFSPLEREGSRDERFVSAHLNQAEKHTNCIRAGVRWSSAVGTTKRPGLAISPE